MSNLIAKINVKTIDIYDDIFSVDELKDYNCASIISKRAFLSNLFYEWVLDPEITIDLYE